MGKLALTAFLFFLACSEHHTGEKARVIKVSQSSKLVEVQVLSTHTEIVFSPSDFDRFLKDNPKDVWLVFDCVKDGKGECDFTSPYTLLVNGELVEIKYWKFLDPIKEMIVAH